MTLVAIPSSLMYPELSRDQSYVARFQRRSTVPPVSSIITPQLSMRSARRRNKVLWIAMEWH